MEKKFVVVAEVPVAFTKMRSVRLRVPEKRLVKVPVVEKKDVVVAEVPVALTKVKFWRLVEPRTERVPVAVRLPPM